jgi:hypothetical protein
LASSGTEYELVLPFVKISAIVRSTRRGGIGLCFVVERHRMKVLLDVFVYRILCIPDRDAGVSTSLLGLGTQIVAGFNKVPPRLPKATIDSADNLDDLRRHIRQELAVSDSAEFRAEI